MATLNRLFWINEDSKVVLAVKNIDGMCKAAISKKSESGKRVIESEGISKALDALGCTAGKSYEIAYVENSSSYSFGIVDVPYVKRQKTAQVLAENQFKGANRIDGEEHVVGSKLVKSDGTTSSYIVCALKAADIDLVVSICRRLKTKISGVYAGIDAAICAFLDDPQVVSDSCGAMALDCGYSYTVAVICSGSPMAVFRVKKSEYARAAEKINEALFNCSRKSFNKITILSGEGNFFKEHVISGAGIKADKLVVSGEVQEYILEGIFMG